ncbi:hypothetical protein E3P86_02135 [Wallemia ichthyophaga]|uniref:GPN-loop GTPase 2 n=1 Tax=Wallemia ichthyophaga TaxID=245174 RepID=A0A4T0JBJ5_WALIC|nr:hypothetical protein E3P86_02135 [Wallemia ichthyophaga]
MTKFGQIVIGPPGAGKTTYVDGLSQFLPALQRPLTRINLDPAADEPPYTPDIDIRDLCTVADIMQEHSLGPNGATLFAFEYIDVNFDWLEHRIEECGGEYLVFDMPGQVELTTGHTALTNILTKLKKQLDCRLVVVNLTDAQCLAEPSRYIAVCLLSLRSMLALEQPQINVLSKIDTLPRFGDLPFNLDYYTQVHDLDYICDYLNTQRHTSRLEGLNRAICEMVEDFGLVSFETLAVEDKQSMTKLVRLTDRVCGYVFQGELSEQDSALSLFTSAMGSLPGEHDIDVQERWLDAREDYDAFEDQLWKDEGELVAEEQSREELKTGEKQPQQQPQQATHLKPTANTFSGADRPKVASTNK